MGIYSTPLRKIKVEITPEEYAEAKAKDGRLKLLDKEIQALEDQRRERWDAVQTKVKTRRDEYRRVKREELMPIRKRLGAINAGISALFRNYATYRTARIAKLRRARACRERKIKEEMVRRKIVQLAINVQRSGARALSAMADIKQPTPPAAPAATPATPEQSAP